MSKDHAIIEELRQAIRQAVDGGDSMGRIAQRAGITRGQISRLAAGKRAPTLANAARIVEALGGELVLRQPRKRSSNHTASR